MGAEHAARMTPLLLAWRFLARLFATRLLIGINRCRRLYGRHEGRRRERHGRGREHRGRWRHSHTRYRGRGRTGARHVLPCLAVPFVGLPWQTVRFHACFRQILEP